MQRSPACFSLRALVVEDDPDTAHSLALLLRYWGCQVAVAFDGPEALGAAPHFRPDVVFLDIELPAMDGWEVGRQIRLLPGVDKALLVALTGRGYEADVRCSKEAGIPFHFVKPVELAVLREVLTSAETLRRMQDQLIG